jgi:hypothetical protein
MGQHPLDILSESVLIAVRASGIISRLRVLALLAIIPLFFKHDVKIVTICQPDIPMLHDEDFDQFVNQDKLFVPPVGHLGGSNLDRFWHFPIIPARGVTVLRRWNCPVLNGF